MSAWFLVAVVLGGLYLFVFMLRFTTELIERALAEMNAACLCSKGAISPFCPIHGWER